MASYDPRYELVIDPVLAVSTYLGGSDEDAATDVALDSFGNIIVVGTTRSADLQVLSAYDASWNGGTDGFIVKISKGPEYGSGLPAGSVVFATYFGGLGNDLPNGVALDFFDQPFVVGETLSTDFPTRNPYDGTLSGARDGFVFAPRSDRPRFCASPLISVAR